MLQRVVAIFLLSLALCVKGLRVPLASRRVHGATAFLQQQRRTLRAANPTQLQMSSSAEPVEAAGSKPAADDLEGLYLQTSLWAAAAVGCELLRPSFPGSPFVRHILPLYTSAALCGKTLSAAAKRNRLDATTFKLLNSGLVLSCIPTVMSTVGIASSWWQLVWRNDLVAAFAVSAKLIHSYVTTATAYSALLAYGLPTIKLSAVGPLSSTYLALAACTLYGLPFTGGSLMLESALSTSMLFALHGAAAAGQKRLSSHTYLALNAAVIISAAYRLFGLVTTYPGRFTAGVLLSNFPLFAVPLTSLATAAVGLFKGVTCKDK
jgi:hypothetical protein